MTKSNKLLVYIELLIVFYLIIFIIIPDWNLPSVTRDYFALLTVGELGFDIYNRIKDL